MKKILLKAYLNLNFGDDLFIKILLEKYPNIKWTICDVDEKYKDVFRHYSNVKINNSIRRKLMRKISFIEKNRWFSKYDAGMYIGGSIFIQKGNWEKQYKERYELIKSFYDKNKPYFILGSNFGPFISDRFIDIYKDLFKYCEDVCLRDTFSYELFKQSNKNVRLAPDIVFSLNPGNYKKKENSVGISIISLDNRKDLAMYNQIYINKIKDMTEEFIKNGKKVTFFSFCEAEGDLEAINCVIKKVNSMYLKDIEIINYTGNIDYFLECFASMENIVATRFHACILSQVFSQGVYPLIYSEKTYNVLKDIGLDQEYSFIEDIDKLSIENLSNIISTNKMKDREILKTSEKQFERLNRYANK